MPREDSRNARYPSLGPLLLVILLLGSGTGWWWARQRRARTILENEVYAERAIRMLVHANAAFRERDCDRNKVHDFWTGDVAGLNCIDIDGKEARLIPLDLAEADGAALSGRPAMAYHGYYFVALQWDESETPPQEYQQSTDAKSGKVHHLTKFGYCAYPATPGVTGRHAIIINENNTTFRNYASWGLPVRTWPTDNALKQEWRRNCGG